MTHESAPPEKLLFVCTANISRSPTVELLLRDRVSQLVPGCIRIESAGIRSIPDSPIDPVMGTLLETRGIYSSEFRSRQMTADEISEATIILTATVDHRSHVARQDASARSKTFTMLEFIRYLEISPRLSLSGTPLQDCLSRANSARFSRGGTFDKLSIEDPYGRSKKAYMSAFKCLDRVAEALAAEIEM